MNAHFLVYPHTEELFGGHAFQTYFKMFKSIGLHVHRVLFRLIETVWRTGRKVKQRGRGVKERETAVGRQV